MLQTNPVSAAGGDALNQLDQLVERAQRKLGSVTGAGRVPASEEALGPAEMDFANPEVLGQFLGQVPAAQAGASPFTHHELDPERVARLLAE